MRIFVSLLAGCGKTSPAASTSSLPARSGLTQQPAQYPGMVPGQTAMPGMNGMPGMTVPGAAGAAAGNAAQILALVRQAQAAQTGFTAQIETYEKGPKGDSEQETLEVAYKRPSTLRVDITQATGEAKGAKVLWTGGSEMKVKPSWIVSHELPLEKAPEAYKNFDARKDGWTKVTLAPNG